MASVADPRRLAALAATGLMDSPAEPAFDRLTRLATKFLGAPVAALSLVDDHRQFFKSAVGLPEPWAERRETPLSHSFCQHVVTSEAPLVVTDAPQHSLVCDNLAIPDLGVMAYLGVPVVTSEGHVLGALCVIDGRPRTWSEDDIATVTELAASAVTEIELRRAVAQAKSRTVEAEAALQALSASEERYRLLAEHASDLVRVHSPERRMIYCSPSSLRLLGYTPAEMLQLSRETLFREEERSRLVGAFATAMRTGVGGAPIVHRMRTKAGEERWFETSLQPVHDASGGNRMHSTSRDVTDRIEAERALLERESRLRRLSNAAFEGIGVSHRGVVLDTNEAFARMFGYEPHEVLGMDAGAFVAPAERERILRNHRVGYEGVYETIGQRKDGTRFPMEARGEMVPWGEKTVRITALRDISERVAGEQSMRLHGQILGTMAEGVCLVRVADEAIVYVNPRFTAIFGYEAGELIGQSVRRLQSARIDGSGGHAVRVSTGDSGQVSYESVNIRKDGTRFWSLATTSTMHHPEHGKVRVVVLEDITERKREAEALERQTAYVELLRLTSADANAATSSSEAMRTCLQRVCEHMKWPIGHVLAIVGNELMSAGIWHVATPGTFELFRRMSATSLFSVGVGLPGRVLQTASAQWMTHLGENTAFVRSDVARISGVRSGFALPVLAGAEVVAVLEFFSEQVEPVDEKLFAVLADVGVQLGRVVERERAHATLARHAAEVQALSLVDELTGLNNRRGFMTLAAQQLHGVSRRQQGALLFFADLNGMKRINDTLGHDAGDEAIRATARILRATFREADVLARLGGDEFVVFAADANPDAVALLRQRLAGQVADYNQRSEGKPFSLSISLGVAMYEPTEPRTLEALLAEADEAMYEQKRARKAAEARSTRTTRKIITR